MTVPARLVLPFCSVALFAVVNLAAISLVGASDARPVLLVCGVLAVAAAVQSFVWDSEGLGAAVLLSLPPLLAVGTGQAAWLIGPLGAMLLLAGELNAAGREFGGAKSTGALARRRVASATVLAAAGIAGSVVVVGAAGFGPSIGGTAALVVAAGALAGLGYLFFGRAEP